MDTHFRACPLCEAICGLELRYEGGQLSAIRGDTLDPFSRGHICPKGNAIIDLESDPDRLKQPMQRVDGRFVPIGWEQAFELAGRRLAEIQSAHGNDTVAAYLGNPNAHHYGHTAYLPALLRLLRSRNVFSASSVDQWPHQLVSYLMYGHQFLIPIPDVDRCDYFLMLGANPVASNGSLMTAPGIDKRLKALVKRGKLVVIDPRRTETAEIASEHHPIRPGSDALFLIALLQVLMQAQPPRLKRYVGKLAHVEEALQAIVEFPRLEIEEHTGIAASTVQRIARELGSAKHAVVYGRMGVSTQTFGSLCQWLIQLLNLYNGQLDAEGGSLPNEPVIPMTGAGTSRGHYGRWNSRVRGLPEFAGELPVAVLREEIETPGAGQVRALLTCAGNPVLSTPDGAALDRALGSLDFMVSIDIYINETTRHADLILPPASFLTQHQFDLIFNLFAVRKVARLSPPVRAQNDSERADWQIVNGLCAAFAAASGKSWSDLPAPRESIAQGLARGGSGLSIEALETAPHGLDLGALTPSLLGRLETADGCIDCAPRILLDELTHLAQSMLTAAMDELKRLEVLRKATPAAELPGALLLIGRRDARSNNSWMHNAPRLVKGKLRHQLLVHPDDLQARGLVDGARVRIRSRTGQVETEVQADTGMMPGVVSLPHGFGHQRAGVQMQRASAVSGVSINDLTDAQALDRPSGNAAFSATPVWLETIG